LPKGPDAIMTAINASIGFDQRLYAQDIAGSRAHAAMLAAQGIITSIAMRRRLGKACSRLVRDRGGEFPFTRALGRHPPERRGPPDRDRIGEAGKRLHTGRSRNDQVAVDFRLWVRDQCDAAIQGLTGLMQAFLAQAEAGADWVMPGFTHLQTAQPVTWGHHMLAYVEMFARDRSPL
jgi:argininosuccinate lyase